MSQDTSDIPASVKEPGLNIGNSEISLGLNMGFNLYDGFYLGLGIKNIRNQNQPFLFYAKPAYAFKSKNIVGTAGIKWNQLINSNARFYLQSHLKSFAFLNKSEYDLDYWRWASAAGVAIDDLNETGYKMVFQFDYERLGRDFPIFGLEGFEEVVEYPTSIYSAKLSLLNKDENYPRAISLGVEWSDYPTDFGDQSFAVLDLEVDQAFKNCKTQKDVGETYLPPIILTIRGRNPSLIIHFASRKEAVLLVIPDTADEALQVWLCGSQRTGRMVVTPDLP